MPEVDKQNILAGGWRLGQLGQLCPQCRCICMCMDRFMSVGTHEPADVGLSKCLCVCYTYACAPVSCSPPFWPGRVRLTSSSFLPACAPALPLGNAVIYMRKYGSAFSPCSVTFKTIQQIGLGRRARPDGPAQTLLALQTGFYSWILLLLQGSLVKRRVQSVLWEGGHDAPCRGGGAGAEPGLGGEGQQCLSTGPFGVVIEL